MAEIAAAEGARRDGLARHRLRRHRGRHGRRPSSWRRCGAAAASSSAGTSTASRRWGGTADIVDYVERNQFFENYRGPGDDFFGSVGSKPEIYPIYWSPAQMQARQSDRMATRAGVPQPQWKHESDGVSGSTPTATRSTPTASAAGPPGADSSGLGTHLDPGTLDLWMTQAYQQAFRHLFDGSVEQYDPWDAAYRTAGPQYPGSTMCSAFRTFQGWTALSDMDHDQGVLHTVPIPEAMAYLMLRPLLADVADDDMCGVTVNQVFPASEKWHPLLLTPSAGIPDVKAGDSVWWHCDMIHSVGHRVARHEVAELVEDPVVRQVVLGERSATRPRCSTAAQFCGAPGGWPNLGCAFSLRPRYPTTTGSSPSPSSASRRASSSSAARLASTKDDRSARSSTG